MSSVKTVLKKFYDPALGAVDTSQGHMKMSAIFVPMFAEMILMTLMSTVNTWILSYYSDDAVAAVGTAGQVVSMVITMFSVISTGASIYMGQMIGAHRDDKASDAAFASIIFMSVLSFTVSSICSLYSRPIMTAMNLSGVALDYAETYFSIVIRFSFLSGVISVFGAVFRSYGKPALSVVVNLIANIVNAFFNWLVIFRPIKSFPLTGVEGISWSRVIALCVSTVVIIIMFLRIPLGIRFRGRSLQSFRVLGEVLRIGIPGGISTLSYNVSQTVTTSIVATLGVAAVSTKIYVANLVYYVYVIGLSLGMATSLMISWMVGAKDYDLAYRLSRQNLRLTVTINLTLSALLCIFGYPLLGIFTSDPEILRMGRTILFIDIFVEVFRGFNHIEENSLRGSGDVFFPMGIAMTSCWFMSVLFCYILGIRLHLGLAGCWFAFGMDEMFRGVNYFFRWRSGKWKAAKIK